MKYREEKNLKETIKTIINETRVPSPDKGKLEKAEGRGRSSTDPKALPYHPKHNPSGYRPGEEPGKSTNNQEPDPPEPTPDPAPANGVMTTRYKGQKYKFYLGRG